MVKYKRLGKTERRTGRARKYERKTNEWEKNNTWAHVRGRKEEKKERERERERRERDKKEKERRVDERENERERCTLLGFSRIARERLTWISALCSIKHAKQKAIVKHRFKLSCESVQMLPSLSPFPAHAAPILSTVPTLTSPDSVDFTMEIFLAKELSGLTCGSYLCRFMPTFFRTGIAWEWILIEMTYNVILKYHIIWKKYDTSYYKTLS